MYISLNWLREYVDLPGKIDPDEFAKLITIRSAEVEGVEDQASAYEGVVIGELLEIGKHPDAEKLNTAKVDIGKKEPLELIFGSMLKMNVGDKVPVAVAPCTLPTGMVIESKVMRGVSTNGMLCLDQELGLKEEGVDIQYFPDVKPGTPFAKAMGFDDTIIEFDNKSLTHRPDLWGHRGIARELSAVMGGTFTDKSFQIDLPASGEMPNIMVNNPELCPRYMGVIIKGVKVQESPDWLKNRLLATDHSVISNIVDVTNYVMEEIGQPLHAFDLKQVDDAIIVRNAHKGEFITTLDGEKKELDESMLLIADKTKPLAVAGVMGGMHSGISDDTVDILIESANFDPTSVRQTSTKLGLRTDSVQRFEKSLDPVQCELAMLRAIELILELCPGATVAGPIADVSDFAIYEPIVSVNVHRINKKIGVDIPAPEMAAYLNMLHFEVQEQVDDSTQEFKVKVPSYRATKDVDIEEDIVEEVARMYGYENIPAIVPDLPAKVPMPNIERTHKHDTRTLMAHALALSESYNYSFYSEATIKRYGLNEGLHLRLKNYLSEEQSHMRVTLIPNLVKSLREAAKFEPTPRLFELGRTYKKSGEFMPNEEKVLAAAILLPKKETNPFAHVRGLLDQFLELFDVDSYQVLENRKPAEYMHPHQTASILVRGKVIGALFTLHPAISEAEGFEGRVACFELNFSALSEARRVVKKYEAQSKFPAIEFDISVLVDKRTAVAELEKSLRKALPKTLTKVNLFDSYEGDKVDTDKKSLAFRLTLQADDRTLTSSDLEEAQKLAWKALEKSGGQIRGK